MADAFNSFMIGDVTVKDDAESMLIILPDDLKEQWFHERQERLSSSTNKIGEKVIMLASHYFGIAVSKWKPTPHSRQPKEQSIDCSLGMCLVAANKWLFKTYSRESSFQNILSVM
ncbi:hypothetical protein VINE108521_13030 [Vibrio neonatus]